MLRWKRDSLAAAAKLDFFRLTLNAPVEELTIMHADALAEDIVERMARCPRLLRVNFVECNLHHANAAAKDLAKFPQLQSVDFRGCQALTDHGMEYLGL